MHIYSYDAYIKKSISKNFFISIKILHEYYSIELQDLKISTHIVHKLIEMQIISFYRVSTLENSLHSYDDILPHIHLVELE